ncbi:MAG: hypothetical protein ACM37W_22955 [Actinomycetota bacterium]
MLTDNRQNTQEGIPVPVPIAITTLPINYRYDYSSFGSTDLQLWAKETLKGFHSYVQKSFTEGVEWGRCLRKLLHELCCTLGLSQGETTFRNWLASNDWGASRWLAQSLIKISEWFDSLKPRLQKLVVEKVQNWSISALQQLTYATDALVEALVKTGKKTASDIKRSRSSSSTSWRNQHRTATEADWEKAFHRYKVSHSDRPPLKAKALKLAQEEGGKSEPIVRTRHLLQVLEEFGYKKTPAPPQPSEIAIRLAKLTAAKVNLESQLKKAVTGESQERLLDWIKKTDREIQELCTHFDPNLDAIASSSSTEQSDAALAQPAVGITHSDNAAASLLKQEYEAKIAALEKALADATSNQQPNLPDEVQTQLERANRINEQLRQENNQLAKQLSQLLPQTETEADSTHYQAQINTLQTQLQQYQQENTQLKQLFQDRETNALPETPPSWEIEKSVLQQRITDLENALTPPKTQLQPNSIVRILQSGDGSLIGRLGRFLGEGTATNNLGDSYPVGKVLIEEGSKYERTITVSNWTTHLEIINITPEEHRRTIAARYTLLENNQLIQEAKQLSQRVQELETLTQAYSSEAIATDLGKALAPAIGSQKVQELIAAGTHGLNAIGRYLRELIAEPAF